jgi:hypothetical protein
MLSLNGFLNGYLTDLLTDVALLLRKHAAHFAVLCLCCCWSIMEWDGQQAVMMPQVATGGSAAKQLYSLALAVQPRHPTLFRHYLL